MVELAVVMAIILVFVVGLVGGLAWVGNGFKLRDRRPPQIVLRDRFAKGEIDETEYLRRLSILEIEAAGELEGPD